MRRLVHAAVWAVGLSACTLLTQLDGLSGGAIPDTSDGSAGDGANLDGPRSDVGIEGEGSTDGGGGGGDGDAAAPCGFPGPTQGLLAYYPFEEGTGSVVHDCSGNHVDGTFVRQAADTWATGIKGGGLRVQTPNGCVDLGVPPSLQSPTMSISAWVNVHTYPVAPASGYVIGQTLNADGSGWRIGTTTGDAGLIGWQHATGGMKYPFAAAGPAVDTWHHLAVTFQPNVLLQIFVDGTSAISQSALPPITFSPVSLRVGCRADDANYFDGIIDELRIYDRVLTATEITALATP